MPKGTPETVEVTITVTQDVKGKKEKFSLTENHPIRGTDVEDFATLARDYGSDERKDEKGNVIERSEKLDVMLFMTNAAQSYLEYGKGIRNGMRNRLLDTLPEDPIRTAKTIKRQIAANLSLFADEAEARAFVLKQRAAKGLPV